MALVLHSVLPVFVMIGLGSLLGAARLTDRDFLKTADRLLYFVLFPAMLFWKIATPAAGGIFDRHLVPAVIVSLASVFILSLLTLKLARVSSFQAGSFTQCCYRFNSYVGMAVTLGAYGEEGARLFALLMGVVIPFLNVLAVSSLIWFGAAPCPAAQKFRLLLGSLVSNPLILACGLGLAFSQLQLPLPGPIEHTLRLMASAALPIALITIGGSLRPQGLGSHFPLALLASGFKLLLLPLIGFLYLRAFQVTALSLQVAMVFFALPTSTAIHILSAQLHSDTNLAAAAVVVSTLLSGASLAAVLMVFGT
jgi:hypothetical protein